MKRKMIINIEGDDDKTAVKVQFTFDPPITSESDCPPDCGWRKATQRFLDTINQIGIDQGVVSASFDKPEGWDGH